MLGVATTTTGLTQQTASLTTAAGAKRAGWESAMPSKGKSRGSGAARNRSAWSQKQGGSLKGPNTHRLGRGISAEM